MVGGYTVRRFVAWGVRTRSLIQYILFNPNSTFRASPFSPGPRGRGPCHPRPCSGASRTVRRSWRPGPPSEAPTEESGWGTAVKQPAASVSVSASSSPLPDSLPTPPHRLGSLTPILDVLADEAAWESRFHLRLTASDCSHPPAGSVGSSRLAYVSFAFFFPDDLHGSLLAHCIHPPPP